MKWDAELYDEHHAFVFERGQDLVDLLAPRPGERILDVGCGTGPLTARIHDAGATVLGVDSSLEMLEKAARAFPRDRYPRLSFEVGDGRSLSVAEPLDAVFSNAALHWMRPPEDVARSIAGALRPGGRFVFEMGGRGNIQAIAEAVVTAVAGAPVDDITPFLPFYFPSLAEYAALLDSVGLEARYAHWFDRPTPLDGGEAGLRNWMAMFLPSLLDALTPERRAALIAEVEERLRPTLWRDGAWVADYVRLRMVAIRRG